MTKYFKVTKWYMIIGKEIYGAVPYLQFKDNTFIITWNTLLEYWSAWEEVKGILHQYF